MLNRMIQSSAVTDEPLLRSLRSGASNAEAYEFRRGKSHDLMVKQCLHELGIDMEELRFLLQDFQYPTQEIDKLRQTWPEDLSRAPRQIAGRPRIVVLISDGQGIRTFLLTDVCRKLSEWADLCILSPHPVADEVVGLERATFFRVPMIRRNPFDTLVGFAGFHFSGSPTNVRMVQRLNESLAEARASGEKLNSTLRVWALAENRDSFAAYEALYCWSLKFFAHAYSLKTVSGLLRQLQPDFVVDTSIISWPGRLWTRAAALNGTPILAYVISWDNMSTKTLIDEFVDTFLIWSDEMEEDFHTAIPYLRAKRRRIVGSPQFEPIHKGRGLLSREEFLRLYKLDPSKQLILYTTGSKTLFPREAECLDRLLAHWRENLRDRANVMVRMHPKDREKRYEDVQSRFPEVPFTLAGANLSEDQDWVPTRGDIDLLVNQLHHCDVIVNMASTMTLEGFAANKPSINIGFDLGLVLNKRYPMADYYKSRHYRDIVESGSARLVENFDEMFSAIDDHLDGKTADVELQRRILRRKCRYTEDASDRIDRTVRELATTRYRPALVRRVMMAAGLVN